MSDFRYGRGAAIASTAATGSSLSASAAGAFTFAESQSKVLVANHPSLGSAALYGLWNDDPDTPAVAANNWDFCIEPGQEIHSPDGILVDCVGLFSATAETVLTDFSVRGWR